ncbi:DUF3784 domain-containing protein [Flavobacteriaceae bacterium]|nr:DUF3784 domain-containing protein [Flavobacteriaceae bacterium]MDA9213079.1 DUF3784 domain-containing protein [Flavobacteriaceae bacterium]MDA9257114.1 DUF3784 domain-containing protein [Flavobacteriaceae bacterium]MDA9373363.1 DUF3784 domain-containing protein [Flavobacteriaceae bacterium]MDB4005618.1 DUF3784 domain-containing protein [Flavobacteriaceae bacterium]
MTLNKSMETEFFIAIIVTNICFIGVAYLTNENNADMLLAGYNTMSKKEKEAFDLKNYLVFFKKFFINLAIYSSLIFLIFYTAFDESTASIAYFISVLLPMPYMIYKGNKFKTKKK